MDNSSTTLLDLEPCSQSFLDEVIDGLEQSPKSLPCKYFYDQRGSQLFDQICDLEEYYLTRTELQIMKDYADEMAQQIGLGVMLVEYGSGSSVKTRLLLDHLEQMAGYVPVDISRKHLQETCDRLAQSYPDLEVLPVCADFTAEFALPVPSQPATHSAVYFPGSTIGNFPPAEAEKLLAQIARLCGTGGGLLIGVDLQKDHQTLESAYDDAQGITAEFNLNLLRRMNREIEGDFKLEQFRHRARYNDHHGRVELFLESKVEQSISVSGREFWLDQGESICTEHSHKYTVQGFAQIAANAGLTLRKEWTDDEQRFAVMHFVKVAEEPS